jgi:site-specific recombinase XerD
MLLSQVFEIFVAEYENANTQVSYRTDVKAFLGECGHMELTDIKPEHLYMWRKRQHDRDYRQETINVRVTKIKRFFNWCIEGGLLAESPAAKLKTKKLRTDIRDKAAPRWLIEKILVLVEEQKNPLKIARDRALLGMLVGYGVRRGDAVSARLSHISQTHFTLEIKGGYKSVKTITSDYRPMLDSYMKMRKKMPTTHDYLFVSVLSPHQCISPNSVERIVRNLSDKAGLAIGPHAIRHWFGQTCADHRIPPTITQALMDHADVTTTLKYYYNQDQTRIDAALESINILNQAPMSHNMNGLSMFK